MGEDNHVDEVLKLVSELRNERRLNEEGRRKNGWETKRRSCLHTSGYVGLNPS